MVSLLGIQTTVARKVQSVRERARLNPVRFTFTSVVVLLGLFLRARGYLFDRHGLWLDEASWAIMLIRDPLITLLIRPIGFMSVTKVLALALGPTEVVLRSLSWIAGVGVVLLAPALSRRLFRASAARLLFVTVLALHPAAIDLSKEFKPYSVSLFGHMAVLYLVLRYLDTQRAAHLVAALVAAPVAGLFAQDMVMAYPGAFLLLGWDTLRRQRHRVPWVIGGATVILLILFAQYWFIWRNLVASDEAQYWGHKYDVFYVKGPRHSHLAWWFEHYRAIAASPGLRSKYWDAAFATKDELKALAVWDGYLWQLIQVAGLVSLAVFRRAREAVVLLLPFATITFMNTTGHWPFGMFRTNLFLLGYAAAIAAMAFEWMAFEREGAATPWLAVVPATLLVLLPLAVFDRSWNARKRALTYDTDMPLMLKALTEREPVPESGEKIVLIVSRRTCDPYEYYSTLNPYTTRKYRKKLERTFDVRCFMSSEELEQTLPELVPPEGHAWLLTDMGGPELEGLGKRLRRRVTFERKFFALPHKLVELTRVAR
ncbi:MAG TPA: glycosyltransferase family 39 protein [Polyangiaceae bacterium]|nr:glycosyltransferase family 39 protein [Polyangiaceae bacterium]